MKRLVVSIIFISLFLISAIYGTPNSNPNTRGIHNVVDYGAKGNGITDCTKSFQKALDAASKDGGGVVSVPTGSFLIKGHLVVPVAVAIEGTMKAPGSIAEAKCSTLLAVEGRGKDDGEPFIFLNQDSTLRGIKILYPKQDKKNPVPYPWCVRGKGDNVSLVDLFLVNPWQGVDLGTHSCGRHYIHGLYGQPLHIGIFIDQCYDVGRIEDVHFWCFWSQELMAFTKKQGIGFMIARTDFQFISNSFCWDYGIGFLFTTRKNGPGGVMLTNCSADGQDRAVVVESSQWHAGVTFNNCYIWGRVEVKLDNYGPVKFNNCAMAPAADKPGNADIAGRGQVSFNQCHFVYSANPVITSDCKGLSISNCDFMGQDTDPVGANLDAGVIYLGANSKATIITGNRFRGGLHIKNDGAGKVVVNSNIDGE